VTGEARQSDMGGPAKWGKMNKSPRLPLRTISSKQGVSASKHSELANQSQACCCDRKSRAAYAQSFATWQQATIEFTCHDHSSRTLLLRSIVHIVSIGRASTPRSLFYCLFAPHIYNGVIVHAHPVRGESHNQRNTTGEVATVPTLH